MPDIQHCIYLKLKITTCNLHTLLYLTLFGVTTVLTLAMVVPTWSTIALVICFLTYTSLVDTVASQDRNQALSDFRILSRQWSINLNI